jgi:YggT family protein
MNNLVNGINNAFNLFSFLIVLRIFLTWIPRVRWENQPWKIIREIADLYLNLFRRVIPPYGGMDFSPIVAWIVLQILRNIITTIIMRTAA